MNRAKKYQLMFDIAKRYAQEGTCPRMQGGAVIFTPDFHVVTSGYNGAPRGLPQCNEVGCLILDGHCARASHSETNAVIQAARVGVSIEGMYMACTHLPCPWCLRVVIQAGLRRLYYLDLPPTYNDEHYDFTMQSCVIARVEIKHWEENYDNSRVLSKTHSPLGSPPQI